MEVWKEIEGYNGLYMVSNFGNIKSMPKEWVSGSGRVCNHDGMIMSQSKINSGYNTVMLYNGDNGKRFLVHRIVATAFIDQELPFKNLVVDHINGNKTDNRVENLQIISQRENVTKNGRGKSKYVGVHFRKDRSKWVASIYINGKQKYIGSFDTEEEASLAYKNKRNETKN